MDTDAVFPALRVDSRLSSLLPPSRFGETLVGKGIPVSAELDKAAELADTFRGRV